MNYELRIDRRMCFPTRDARPTACRANSLHSPGQHPGGGFMRGNLGLRRVENILHKKEQKKIGGMK